MLVMLMLAMFCCCPLCVLGGFSVFCTKVIFPCGSPGLICCTVAPSVDDFLPGTDVGGEDKLVTPLLVWAGAGEGTRPGENN